jgi:hypothetical protein
MDAQPLLTSFAIIFIALEEQGAQYKNKRRDFHGKT